MPKFSIPFLLLLILGFSACRRDAATSWDIDAKVPFLKGSIGWDAVSNDSLFEADSDGLLHLIYADRFKALDLDTLVALPDTAIATTFEPPFSGGPFNVPPGAEIITNNDNINMNLEQVQLKEVRIESGTLTYRLRSYVDGALQVDYSLPGVILPAGSNLDLSIESQAGSDEAPWEFSNEIDMAGAVIWLGGNSGTSVNRIETALTVSASANNLAPVPVMGDDSVTIQLSFSNLRVGYARGFFGQMDANIEEVIDLAALTGISGQLNLDALELKIELNNKVGADVQIVLDEVTATTPQGLEQDLLHSIMHQTVNITRATDAAGGVIAQSYEVTLNQDNSNIIDLFSTIPEALRVAGDVRLNPLGDLSGGNDFIYTADAFEAQFALDVPLCLSTGGLYLTDTLDFQAFEGDWSADARLLLEFTNGFPLEVEAMELAFLAEDGSKMPFSIDLNLAAASYSGLGQVQTSQSVGTIELTRELLDAMKQGGRMVFALRLASYDGQEVKFTGEEELGIEGVLEGILEMRYE